MKKERDYKNKIAMIHKEKMRYIMKKQILEKNRTKKRLHKIGKKIDEKQKNSKKYCQNR